MTKFQWEQQLSKYLSELPKEERGKVLEYYDELFCDKYESGESEDRIIVSFGEPSRIALEILRSYDSGQLFSDASQGMAGGQFNAARTFTPPVPPPVSPPKIHQPNAQNNQSAYQNTSVAASGFQNSYNSNQNVNKNNGSQDSFYNNQNINKNNSGAANQPLQKMKRKHTHPLMIVLYIFLFVTVGIPLISGIFGIAVGLIATIFALAACSIAGLASAVLVLFMGLPLAQTLACIGISLFVSGIGFLCTSIGIKVIKGICRLISKIKAKISEKRAARGN